MRRAHPERLRMRSPQYVLSAGRLSLSEVQLPLPGRAERFFERPLGTPAQEGVRQRGIGPDRRDVSGAARRIVIVQLSADDLFRRIDNFFDAGSLARAEVDCKRRSAAHQFLQRQRMRPRQVGNMNIIDNMMLRITGLYQMPDWKTALADYFSTKKGGAHK